MKRSIYLLTLLFSTLSLLHAYTWPTNATRLLSGTFGERRSAHLHAGIDVKTWARSGYECYAVGNGYIERIRESSGGYGKVLYLKLDDGNTAVYAHLDRYYGNLETLIRSQKIKQRTHLIERGFEPNEIRVREGALIAYTGGTGTQYAHLHFELRDSENRPLNPELNGFPVEDRIPPHPLRVSLTPLDSRSAVMGLNSYGVFPLSEVRENIYATPDTIQASGSLRVDIEAYDQSLSGNKNGVYQITLYHQGKKKFHKQYDRFNFDENEFIRLDRNFRLAAHGHGSFQALYSDEITRRFSPYDSTLNGVIEIQPGYQLMVIQLRDANGSRSSVRLDIMGTDYPQQTFRTEKTDNFFVIYTDSLIARAGARSFALKKYNAFGHLQQEEVLHPHQDLRGGNIILNLRDLQNSLYTLQYTDSLGFTSYPQFFHFNEGSNGAAESLKLRSHQYADRVVLEIYSDKALANEYLLTLEEEAYRSITLKRVSMHSLHSDPLPLDELENVRSLSVFEKTGLEWQHRKQFFSRVIRNQRKWTWMSPDSSLALIYPRETFYQDAFTWLEELPYPYPVPGGERLSSVWTFFPADIPSRKGFSLAFRFRNSYPFRTDMGIYSLDLNRNEWRPERLLENETDFNFIDAKGLNGGAYAVLRDTLAPEILSSRPGNGGSYSLNDLNFFAELKDNLSGFGDGSGISVFINGQWTLFNYNVYTKRVDVDTEGLGRGRHSLLWRISDAAGNSMEERVSFTIR